MKPALTPWFPGDVMPARHGWYERDWDGKFDTNDYFDGKNWFNGEKGNRTSSWVSTYPRPWRGLAEDPAKAAP